MAIDATPRTISPAIDVLQIPDVIVFEIMDGTAQTVGRPSVEEPRQVQKVALQIIGQIIDIHYMI